MKNTLEQTVELLQTDVESIKARNRRVEADKAWETSTTRTLFIAISSFLLIYIVMSLAGADNPFLNALISTTAYLLSTATYGILKQWWLRRN